VPISVITIIGTMGGYANHSFEIGEMQKRLGNQGAILPVIAYAGRSRRNRGLA